MLLSNLKRGFLIFIDPLMNYLISKRYTPDTFTILGLIFNIIAAVFYSFGLFFEAGVVMAFGSTTDVIDGQLARRTGAVSTAGAILDSVLDRYSEVFVLTGLLIHYAFIGWNVTVAVAAVAIAGSLLVSYVRARAEGLGFDCRVGFMQRPERVIFLATASVFGVFLGSPDGTVAAALWLLAAGTHYTTIERMIYVRRLAKIRDHASTRDDA
jgi:CDP-diacylglycerol---glycerol-3-phosphate 3-phosphatidyltransferase